MADESVAVEQSTGYCLPLETINQLDQLQAYSAAVAELLGEASRDIDSLHPDTIPDACRLLNGLIHEIGTRTKMRVGEEPLARRHMFLP